MSEVTAHDPDTTDERLRTAIERDPETADRETLQADLDVLRREDAYQDARIAQLRREAASETGDIEAELDSTRAQVEIIADEYRRALAAESGLSSSVLSSMSAREVIDEVDQQPSERRHAIYAAAASPIAERWRTSPDITTSTAGGSDVDPSAALSERDDPHAPRYRAMDALLSIDTRTIGERATMVSDEASDPAEYVRLVYDVEPAEYEDDRALFDALRECDQEAVSRRRGAYRRETQERADAALRDRIGVDEIESIAELRDAHAGDESDR